jgi:hypothetical protein
MPLVSDTAGSNASLIEYDRIFVSVLHEIERYYMEFSKAVRIRIEKWVQKLSLTGHNLTWKKHRNAYAKLLLHMVLNRDISGPFVSLPPSGSIPSFPTHLKAYSVRGAYDRSGGGYGLAETGKKWRTEPGNGTGGANYVAGTIINTHNRYSTAHGRGASKYMPYLPGRDDGATSHSTLFWRDVYEAVRESPMGEGIAQSLRVQGGSAIDDERDVVINHIFHGGLPPPSPPRARTHQSAKASEVDENPKKDDHSPRDHVDQNNRTTTITTAVPHTTAAAHAGITAAHRTEDTNANHTPSSPSTKKMHESASSAVRAANAAMAHAAKPSPTPKTLRQKNEAMHDATKYVIAHGGGITKFHYSTDEDGCQYMADSAEANLEIRRLALLAREQQLQIESLKEELQSEKDAAVTRLQKQAVEHVQELRAVLTGSCTKCNLALSGCDEDDSLDGQDGPHNGKDENAKKHVTFGSTSCNTSAESENTQPVHNNAQTQWSPPRNRQQTLRSPSSPNRKPLKTALRIDPQPDGAQWMFRGTTIGTDTEQDGPSNPLARDRIACAWEALLEMDIEPLDGPIANFPAAFRGAERYYNASYWQTSQKPSQQTYSQRPDEHTVAFSAHLSAKQATQGTYVPPADGYVTDAPLNTNPIPVFLPSTSPPRVAISRSQLSKPSPDIKPLRSVHDSVVVEKQQPQIVPVRTTQPEQSFAFLERRIERAHFEHERGSVGTMFGPAVRDRRRF